MIKKVKNKSKIKKGMVEKKYILLPNVKKKIFIGIVLSFMMLFIAIILISFSLVLYLKFKGISENKYPIIIISFCLLSIFINIFFIVWMIKINKSSIFKNFILITKLLNLAFVFSFLCITIPVCISFLLLSNNRIMIPRHISYLPLWNVMWIGMLITIIFALFIFAFYLISIIQLLKLIRKKEDIEQWAKGE